MGTSLPPQIHDAKEFSVSFASAVTERTGNEEDYIAKNGDESLFELMRKISPQVSFQINFFERMSVKHLIDALCERKNKLCLASSQPIKLWWIVLKN
jgi:hypothetical protein